MKWVNLINSNLKDKEIRKLMLDNNSIDDLLFNIDNYEDNIKYEIEKAYKNEIYTKDYRIISYYDSEYPEYLKHIPNFPVFLYLKGKKLNLKKSVSVVGTRNYTDLGKKSCEKIISDLANYNNMNIVSGLAKGIDSIALKKAVDLNITPVAIMPTDILSCYPIENIKLKEKIEEIGTLISEFRINTKLNKKNFVIRNRLIAGISRAVYIAQSFKSGGSMITAKFAMDYNKEIYCTPSNIFDKSFEGCNDLIMKNGAKLINSGYDIGYEYGWRKKSEEIFSNS
ncbi:DNA-processing protein DprA [Oceanivirga salmonicida]|uniref:DNA-processing protein DprA n=1 Tax=Oceanivirga salmonicida TaxID=1769291 RepID=UPI00082AB241|nr:DNA-processing protein DprA [Oceanivirga salmonicida]